MKKQLKILKFFLNFRFFILGFEDVHSSAHFMFLVLSGTSYSHFCASQIDSSFLELRHLSEYKLVQQFWLAIWCYIETTRTEPILKTKVSFTVAISLIEINPKEIVVYNMVFLYLSFSKGVRCIVVYCGEHHWLIT